MECLAKLPDESVQCCVTSPPYWGLRDYLADGQIGLEKTPSEYLDKLTAVFSEVRRVLKTDGVCFVNMGDSYCGDRGGSQGKNGQMASRSVVQARTGKRGVKLDFGGLKPKNLCGMPWRLAFALQDEGWNLRQDIIWNKPNPMPESVTDRCTKAHEYVFLLSKSTDYFWEANAMREPGVWPAGTRGAKGSDSRKAINGVNARPPEYKIYDGFRNKRSVWTIPTRPFPGAHFATFPEELAKLCIMAGSRHGDTILDTFAGSGTTGKVAIELGRNAILIELNPEYVEMIKARTNVTMGMI